jgi:hypothetical protein
VIEACHFFLVPSRSFSTSFYPSIMLRARECASTPCSSVIFSLGLTFESLKELGVRHLMSKDYEEDLFNLTPCGYCNRGYHYNDFAT